MSVIVCGGTYVHRRRILRCPGACKGHRRRVVQAEGSPWYGPTFTCCSCGDSWSSDGIYPRPFKRGWRKEAITRARDVWRTARSGPIRRDDDMYPIPDDDEVGAA